MHDKIQAKKALGQHFLFNDFYLNEIIKYSLELEQYKQLDMHLETILEIGPGLGTLTDKLSKFAAKNQKTVISVEKDSSLYQNLHARWNNVKCILSDALTVNWNDLDPLHTPSQRVLVANLPYNVSAPMIVQYLSNPFAARYCVLVQKEMAERVCAKVGSKDYGRLAVLSQAFCNTTTCFDIHGDIFKPKTKVMSSFLIIEPDFTILNMRKWKFESLDMLVRTCFAQRRKMLSNVIPKHWHQIFVMLNIDIKKRAENLTVQDYIKLAEYFTAMNIDH